MPASLLDRIALLLALALMTPIAASAEETAPVKQITVTEADGVVVLDPLVANDRAEAQANTRRIHDVMAAAPAAAAVHFPAGDYYFHGAARPNGGTIELDAPGQILYGDGADVTNLIQCDARPDFGFEADSRRKHVPTATVRVLDKGCRVRDLSVLVDDALPSRITLPSAAIQIASIRRLPDDNIAIVETTGLGTRFLIDFVNVYRVNVGRNLAAATQSDRFFAVGIDIVGAGGEVKVYDIDRLDAIVGIRLDNGNHCGQGGYYFENIHMVGRHGMHGDGVFFDWVGGQAPFIRNCNALYVSGVHAGPLGSAGDRLEPTPEAMVYRRPDKSWDWFTLHNHPVVDEPNPAQRTEWYGLPRHAKVVRVASEPRTGGVVWREGADYTVETVTEADDLQHASRIHWTGDQPAPGSSYYVEFEQPIAYRVHDLQWGCLMNAQLGEANQSGPDAYTLRFTDQDYGYRNPDFRFPVGYGFFITNNMVLNGSFYFEGWVDNIRMEGNTTGVCDLHVRGADADRPATRMTFSRNDLNSAHFGDHIERITFSDNQVHGVVKVDAPTAADLITLSGNHVYWMDGGIALSGAIRNVRIKDNDVRPASGDGIVLRGVVDGIISGNNVSGCTGDGLVIRDCRSLSVTDNILNANANGIVLDVADDASVQVRDNIRADNGDSSRTESE